MEIELSEKQVEDEIFDGQLLRQYGITCISRQISGIPYTWRGVRSLHDLWGTVDIIGYHHRSKSWVIVELKKGIIDSHAYCQIARYMRAAESTAHGYWCNRMGRKPRFFGLLIGSHISEELQFLDFIAESCLSRPSEITNQILVAKYKAEGVVNLEL